MLATFSQYFARTITSHSHTTLHYRFHCDLTQPLTYFLSYWIKLKCWCFSKYRARGLSAKTGFEQNGSKFKNDFRRYALSKKTYLRLLRNCSTFFLKAHMSAVFPINLHIWSASEHQVGLRGRSSKKERHRRTDLRISSDNPRSGEFFLFLSLQARAIFPYSPLSSEMFP